MDEGQIKENVSRLEQLRSEINNLKKDLNKLNREKESWFSKRTHYNKKILSLIGGVKGSKDERNERTESVQELKNERD